MKLRFTSLTVNPTTFYTLKNISRFQSRLLCDFDINETHCCSECITLQVTQEQRALQNIAVCILGLIRIVLV